jgi:hypothetical protein
MGLIRQLWRPLNPGPISPICRVCRSPKGHALCWTYVRPRSSIRATCPEQGTYHCSALRVPGLMLGPLGWSPMVLRYNHIWLVVWNMAFMTFHILGRIIPTDFHIFQRCWNHQPDINIMDNYWLMWATLCLAPFGLTEKLFCVKRWQFSGWKYCIWAEPTWVRNGNIKWYVFF